ncbi:MAG: HEAT repeat domain-containing protein [Actinomycetota bacterium]|nr:HEAT repeat domain-containing protein [Actinomycetota bacterium]
MTAKDKLKKLLDNKDFEKLSELTDSSSSIIRSLFSLLYSTDDLTHWRAAEALGMLAGRQVGSKSDSGRNIPRRLLWSLMEESGATAWPAPEALGAVVAYRPSLFTDYAPIVLSFIDDPILHRGVLWSARKIAEKRPDLIRNFVPKVIELLGSPDPTTRGHAAWALGAMGAKEAVERLKKLSVDSNKLYIYNNGELQEKTVGELAINSVKELQNRFG